MAALTLISREQAAGIRRAAVSVDSVQSLKLEGLYDHIAVFADAPQTLRVGERPTRDIRHMDERSFRAFVAARPFYRERLPRCRECGERIEAGSKLIRFQYAPTTFWPWGREAFLHAEPCSEGGVT